MTPVFRNGRMWTIPMNAQVYRVNEGLPYTPFSVAAITGSFKAFWAMFDNEIIIGE